jgi:hypothetical protein
MICCDIDNGAGRARDNWADDPTRRAPTVPGEYAIFQDVLLLRKLLN